MLPRALLLVAVVMTATALHAATPSFLDFDRRAKAGEPLTVVFFGASLTWGANATDPQLTSYRAQIAERLGRVYPQAHFQFFDAAIGGTGSQLGVFRLDRDVLARKPDLVFLDFSANDDINSANPETLASYEALLRRLITEAKVPVVQVIFPFQWNVEGGKLEEMKRRTAHLALAAAYGTGIGDAIALAIDRVASGATTVKALWPYDGVHPGNAGYVLFADAAWNAFTLAVARKQVCAAPEKMLYADTYLKSARVRFSSLPPLPAGWSASHPNLTSAFYDMLMSRWLDDEVVAHHGGKQPTVPVERLRARFRGSMAMLFGESTQGSSKFKVYIDGKLNPRLDGNKPPQDEFDGARLASACKGNVHLIEVLATGLDPAVEHTIEIEPAFVGDGEQELRLESLCVAGPQATVTPWPKEQ